MVTADGRFLIASEKENEDLFWALRGGGGNFGVVTALEYQLAPVDTIYGGPMLFEMSDGSRGARGLPGDDQRTHQNSSVVFRRSSSRRRCRSSQRTGTGTVHLIVGCWAGEPERGEQEIAASGSSRRWSPSTSGRCRIRR